MKDIEIDKRKQIYQTISNDLSLLNDTQLVTLLENSTPIANTIGGATALLKISDTNIFIKKIRLTNIERLPENWMSTANLFHLPLYYQYGVGSAGFGAWRELTSHVIATNWVITGKCPNFPILYHWRILPSTSQKVDEAQLVKLNKDVKYWNNSSAIHDRLYANLCTSADIVLFLEYFPQNLYQWFGKQIAQGDSAIKASSELIEKHLSQTISFMKSQNFIHFDAHFHNILTDGKLIYFSDFGLAMSANFELSKEERNFFNEHLDYDSYSAATNFLHCFVTHYAGKDNWIESLQKLVNEEVQKLPPNITFILKQYAPTAVLMDQFYRDLQKDKTTIYPAAKLKHAWDNANKITNYQIKTKRLGLRLLAKEDITYLYPLESDPEVKVFFPDGPRDRAKTENMINRFITAYTEKGLPCFLLFDLNSGEFVGRAGFGLTESGETEVGYVLHKKFWGKGFASEAVTALLEYAKKHIDVDYIVAYADTGNFASTRVMEKCGMTYYKTDIAKGIECKFYKVSNREI